MREQRRPNYLFLAGAPVLVTGATGFTGSNLVKKLVKIGAKVTAIARNSSDLTVLQGLPIKWVRGDVFDENVVREAIHDVSYIFHVAAAYREAKVSAETYHNVHVKSTQLLAIHALAQPDFKRFVHISTVGVHGHIENPPANEDYPFHPGDIYQQTKAEAELWIREFSQKNGLPIAVVRPAAIFGPGDKRLFKVFKMASRKWFPVLGSGNGFYHLIHVDDLTDFFLFVAINRKAVGQVFICGNSEPIQLRNMARIIAGRWGRPIHFIRIPASPFFALGFFCEMVCRPLNVEPPIYRRRVAFYTKDRAFDTSKMRALGFTPKYSNQQGLVETAQWYQQKGWLR